VDVGRAVAEYLHARGRRRLAMVAGDDERATRRQQAFEAAVQRLGLPPVHITRVPAPTTLKSGRQAMASMLVQSPETDAVFCSSDLLAMGVMTEARVRGIDVPRQLAVVGFGDLDFAADMHPALSTVRIDGTAIGRQAARFIVDRAEGRAVAQPIVDIGFSIIERDSA
jgi:LacI family transcriptional regulator, gluconate utilization system Gnt-I transcriptional repressor